MVKDRPISQRFGSQLLSRKICEFGFWCEMLESTHFWIEASLSSIMTFMLQIVKGSFVVVVAQNRTIPHAPKAANCSLQLKESAKLLLILRLIVKTKKKKKLLNLSHLYRKTTVIGLPDDTLPPVSPLAKSRSSPYFRSLTLWPSSQLIGMQVRMCTGLL